MLEELGEAALFEAWLGRPNPNPNPNDGTAGGHVLLLRGSEALLGDHLQPTEYLGAMCDLVGEVGRYAVLRVRVRVRVRVS